MAFPTIQTADTKSNMVTSNSSSWTLTYPTNLASGDLILAFVATDGATTPTFPGAFVVQSRTRSAVTLHYAKAVSDGTETGNFTLSLSASEQGAWRIFRITDWGGTLGTTFLQNQSSDGDVESDNFFGASNAPDPPSVNPFQWDVEDTLWIAACAADTSRTISVYPMADNQTADVSGGSNGATLGLCTANDAVASKDPGTFTISASDDWATATIAVRPAAAGGSTYTKAGFGKEHG